MWILALFSNYLRTWEPWILTSMEGRLNPSPPALYSITTLLFSCRGSPQCLHITGNKQLPFKSQSTSYRHYNRTWLFVLGLRHQTCRHCPSRSFWWHPQQSWLFSLGDQPPGPAACHPPGLEALPSYSRGQTPIFRQQDQGKSEQNLLVFGTVFIESYT